MRAHKTADDVPANEQPSTMQEHDLPVDGSESTRGAGDADTPPRSIAKDDAFHLLQNSRRRAVLRYLLAHADQERFVMRDLAEEVAAWEHDTTVQQLTSDERQRVYIALYQSHLPKLDEYDVIRYNQNRGVVKPTPLIAVLEPFLEGGLHADSQHLTLETTTDGDAHAESNCQAGILSNFAGLFSP